MNLPEYEAAMEKIKTSMNKPGLVPPEERDEIGRLIGECEQWEKDNIHLPEPTNMNGLMDLWMHTNNIRPEVLAEKLSVILQIDQQLILKCLTINDDAE